MIQAFILNIANKKPFPLEAWKTSNLSVAIQNYSVSELDPIALLKDKIYILYIDLNEEEYQASKVLFNRILEENANIKFIMYSGFSSNEFSKNKSSFGLESPIRKSELKLIIEKTFLSEFYKNSALEIGNACLNNVGFFEGVFELARKENMDSKDTTLAFELILDYEKKNKVSKDQINQAIDRVIAMKDSELIQMNETLKANEKLNRLRESELKEEMAIREATEKALQFSHAEEMNMQKIIKAQDKIFEYTDKEIRALVEENKQLKQQLGLKN